jgi:hypothetical protein
MIYVLSGLLATGVLTAVCWPLFSRDESLDSVVLEETEWDLLERKKEVILGNIQDLDFEFKCGKLSEEDHRKLRAELAAEAGAVFEAIDRIEASQDLDALIRREVTKRRERVRSGPTSCPDCGEENEPGKKFCGECGARLAG